MSEEPLVSWAQNREDIVLWRALGHITDGTYVDVGAADPEDDSVTKLFYDRGWSGLNVEPVAEFVDRLSKQRERDITVQACAGSTPGIATLHIVVDTGLSSLDDKAARRAVEAGYHSIEQAAEVVTMDQILETAGFGDRDIHFLKIDVEGFEREVLDGLDLSVWRPWVVVIEATAPNSTDQVHEEWEPDLLKSGYEFCVFDGLNRFYVAEGHAELRSVLSYPACALDLPFISAAHSAALAAYEELLESTQTLERELVATRSSYALLECALSEMQQEYERLTTIYQQALDSYERQAGELDSVLDSYERQAGELDSALASYERQAGELESATQSNASLRGECATLRVGVQQMAVDVDRLRRVVRDRDDATAEAQAALERITTSTSWRLTRPIRTVADRAKGLRRNTAP